MTDPDALLQAAETVARVLERHQIETIVIGAVALAAHHYVRQTEDVDLGINVPLAQLEQIANSLRDEGFQVKINAADSDDPLGGVIDIRGSFGLIQVINFGERFPAVIDDALRASCLYVREGSPLRLTPLPHLVALKLYAGGYKSKADIVELLSRNPDLDLNAIRALCARYRLKDLEELISEAGQK